MRRLLKDPLIHFLAIGVAIFVVSVLRGHGFNIGRERIVVTGDQVAQARAAATVLQQREPSAAELAELIEPIVREEVLYREALALGLDKNDDEVRRRLVEKMSYLSEDLADPAPSSEQELRTFYEGSPELFTIPELVTFDQVFFNPASHADDLQAAALMGLERLRRGEDPMDVGDSTPLRAAYAEAPREQVNVLFGEAMTDALFSVSPGEWTGPYRSDFGLHVARLRSRTESRLPPFEEISARVADEFAAARRRAVNEAAYRRMRAKYDVLIEPPTASLEGAERNVGAE